jgi:SAM-dependent methyltransferase
MGQTAAVEGFTAASYGDAFADVYDEWYADISDPEASAVLLADLAGSGPALELGIGTGRLALPLAAQGVPVSGIDASAAMVEGLRAKPGGDGIPVAIGDMADVEPPVAGPFSLVYVAYNTLFNLDSAEAQRRCFGNVAARLADGGRFVVEAFVPTEPGEDDWRGPVDVRVIEIDRVVVSFSRRDPTTQTITGQHVEIRESGIRLRPWLIRYAGPDELDAMAAAAGLDREDRWSDWGREPFSEDSPTHVSVYRRAG